MTIENMMNNLVVSTPGPLFARWIEDALEYVIRRRMICLGLGCKSLFWLQTRFAPTDTSGQYKEGSMSVFVELRRAGFWDTILVNNHD
ncbi:hypothetical protein Dda_6920 [Drechslerella dactyloides]|uniref:Uncharacterized protein n=1 Tax=Drechslerella dactyloides TaxID=74499 RepID=A0AAD6NIM8_DREDA|nr:hypothetical protein Dda_6920 [Drechslerella dactyloides]